MFNLLKKKQSDGELFAEVVENFFSMEFQDKSKITPTLNKIQKRADEIGSSWQVQYFAALATRNFCSWYIRGDERKAWFEKQIRYLEKAIDLSIQHGIKKENINSNLNGFFDIGLYDLKEELARLLIDEKLIRNVPRGIEILEEIRLNSIFYYPAFCSLVDGYYKLKDYDKAIEVSVDVRHRMNKYMSISGSIIGHEAYRAKAKQLKKMNNTKGAIALFQEMINLGMATENDREILKKLIVNKYAE